MRNDRYDPRALRVARFVLERERPELAILFGSRARGDHDELRSDIDVMLVLEAIPDDDAKRAATESAGAAVEKAYGREVPVELVWRSLEEFRRNRRYVNSVETNAVRDGIVMPRNPNEYGSSRYEDEETEYDYDWTNYDERLRHAETHLDEFVFMAESGRSDIAIGQHAQGALEHGMKALLEAHGASYRSVHNIGELLGNIRRNDPEMSDFGLSIPADVYTEYVGDREYRRRLQPELTSYPDYLERTREDAQYIIDRAREVRSRR